jgi:transmembrane sensor
LDADSALKVWPRMVTERRLELTRGRAFFQVAKDRRRPFIVRTDKGAVTALGTAFDVRRDAAGMKIVLLEGRVRIQPSAQVQTTKPLEMAAGYEFIGDGVGWQLLKTDSVAETSWIRGDLIFDDQPLSTIVEDLNRYGGEKIVIADPEVGRRRLSAVLKAGDSKLFLASVQTLGLASVKRSDQNEIMLVPPQ